MKRKRIKTLTADSARMLNEKDILSMSLHSKCTKDERQDIMRTWNNNQLKVLVSTIHDGIDSSQCKHVYIVGGSYTTTWLYCSLSAGYDHGNRAGVMPKSRFTTLTIHV